MLLVDGFERGELIYTRIVDQNVEAADCLMAASTTASASALFDTSLFTATALPPFLAISATTLSAPFLSDA